MNDTQQLNYTLSHLIPRLGVLVHVAIVVVAVIGARRHKLGGLWFLAAAAAVLALREVANAVLSPSLIANKESVMWCLIALQYVPFFAAIVALCGWCVLVPVGAQGRAAAEFCPSMKER